MLRPFSYSENTKTGLQRVRFYFRGKTPTSKGGRRPCLLISGCSVLLFKHSDWQILSQCFTPRKLRCISFIRSGSPTRWEIFRFRGAEKSLFQLSSPTRWEILRFRGAEKSLFQSGSPTRWKIFRFRGAEKSLFQSSSPTR